MKRFAEFQLDDKSVLVSGQVIQAFANCLNSDHVIPVLEKHGLVDVDPVDWYPFAKLINVMQELGGATYDLVSIGMKIMETADWPAEFYQMPFADVLYILTEMHRSSHQGETGGYQLERVDKGHVIIDANVPYPDDLIYGIYWQVCRQLLPVGSQFVVQYDQSEPIRKEGGKITRLHVQWNQGIPGLRGSLSPIHFSYNNHKNFTDMLCNMAYTLTTLVCQEGHL